MHERFLSLIAFIAFAAVFSGCKVGPNYSRPCARSSNAWIDSPNPRLQGQTDDPNHWWLVFGDERLCDLVQRAANENLTLKQAGLRVAEARYQRGIATGSFFPQTQLAAGHYNHRQLSKNNANFRSSSSQRNFDQVALGSGVAWELDFWGRFRRSIEVADAELDASIHGYDAALVILLGDVANTYIDIRTLERRLQLARENVQIQYDTFALVQKKFDGGLVSELDVAQSKANLHQTESLIPSLGIRYRQASNLLCILLGMPPIDLEEILGRTEQIPVPPSQVAVGIPADLLRQRPDVRRAERQLAAQCSRIGVAASDFYPHLSIAGTLNVESKFGSNLLQSGSLAGVVGPNFRWDILNYGRIKNNVRMQDAAFNRLAHAYEQSILEAHQQVEDGLVTFVQTHEKIASLEKTVEASSRAVQLSSLQYRAGTVDFNRVFQSQVDRVKQQDQLATAQGELAQSLVSVYRALGGGWQIRLNEKFPVARELTEDVNHSPQIVAFLPPPLT